jgi:hypothetical protein
MYVCFKSDILSDDGGCFNLYGRLWLSFSSSYVNVENMARTNVHIQVDIIGWMRWMRTDLSFDVFLFDNNKGYV